MSNQNLNLARKWRPATFDLVVGQDLSVRILKNALYLNSFFPVYLFAGQRGCGKTSTARIFAAAANCHKLFEFQNNPKSVSVPCIECVSCVAMQNGKHPDFVEIDAASYTGVDNVRQIIEASTFLPLMGNKKIYLIDEAHMLSKAAFNAFLKIMEEPPINTIFILATTDIHKIIDTVRSRCFQVFFTNINQDTLVEHLKDICVKESVNFDDEGLKIIARESKGSARDAINLLEQVRFSAPIVSYKTVLNALGYLSDESILNIFNILIKKSSIKELLQFLDEIDFNNFSAQHTWEILIECFRASIRIKQGIDPTFLRHLKIEDIIKPYSLNDILFVMEEISLIEPVFLKTINKHSFLEMLFLRILKREANSFKDIKYTEVDEKNEIVRVQDIDWSNFIQKMNQINEPMISSIFSQAIYIGYDSATNEVKISFDKKSQFFQEMLNDSSRLWVPILNQVFNDGAKLNINFQEQKVEEKTLIAKKEPNKLNKESSIDVSDTNKWQIANMLLKNFSGVIKEVKTDE